MKKLVYPAIVIATLSGCSPKQDQKINAEEKCIKVSTSEVKSEKIEVSLRYSGTIEPSQTIPLSFQTTGTVEKVLVDAGDAVKKGQLLATIDRGSIQNMYDISLAKYQQAKDAYDRLKNVHDQGSLPEIKWVEMETNLAQAKSSLDLSANNLEKCNMCAPEDGIIGRRNIEPGMSSISITSSPIELVKIKTIYVKISVPENEIGKIFKGLKANIAVSALNEKSFEGEVTNISPVADAFSRTYDAKITVNNANFDLKPGMVCDVTLNLKSERELVLIPYQSVTMDNDSKAFVYIVDSLQKKVKKQIIQTGNYHGNDLEVLSGLKRGQIVVKEGKEKLSDNSLISL
jgi:membrane fusion protein, multidrug efflux system